MSNNEETLKMVKNLDRTGVEARLAEVRAGAEAAGLAELAQTFSGVEGAPRAQLEEKVKGALKGLAGKPEHKSLVALLELVEINLPNLN
jgi:hypothetical protein